MSELTCPGLPARWINAWLAAVGATVLDHRIHLRWTSDTGPLAVLSAEDFDPAKLLADAWPTKKVLQSMPISEHWDDEVKLQRRVPLDTFIERVRAARGHPYLWTLSSTLTDLHVSRSGEVEHAPFDPSGPGTTKWLHHRLVKVHSKVVDPGTDRIHDSLSGLAARTNGFGLGFDSTRFGSQADKNSNWVDPVVEVLAFFALKLLPVRGIGVDERKKRSPSARRLQRGWKRSDQKRIASRFRWPAWSQPLDAWGIDALMDFWIPERRSTWKRFGVHAGWQSVSYQPRKSSDPTKAFASEDL